MSIKILVTGGTFDKEYDIIDGKLLFMQSHLRELLDSGRCSLNIEIEIIMMKDSLDMTDNDRQIILNQCKRTKQERIIITHGTDTMVETAKVLANHLADKTIILTGAMVPIRFGSSDGLFNLGSSLGFVQTLPHGVYISMNGRYFHWNNVRKNKLMGTFEELAVSDNKPESDKHAIIIDNSNVEEFMKTAKGFVGLDVCDTLSLEDIYSIASKYNLNGIIYLEKFDDRRHVNVLLALNKDTITIYDPLSGVKVKPYNNIHFGMYCKPVGIFKDEFRRYERQFDFDKSGNVWEVYNQKGKILFDFLMQNKIFNSIYTENVGKVDFPTLQNNMSSSECVPHSLLVMSLCNALHLES